MKKRYRIPRRSFLRGAGVCMALPALEIMQPATAIASGSWDAREREGEKKTDKIPLRLGIFHKGNGIDPTNWEATGSETKFSLSKNLAPLENCKKEEFQTRKIAVIIYKESTSLKGYFMEL